MLGKAAKPRWHTDDEIKCMGNRPLDDPEFNT
jgi:hypothetical protein